ncbi:MAG: AarF/ABC1/UbiB kinase family protein [Streptosporangiales bacterium]|nr:AarF/ABC1/UbiB kinase family protein [Streptosporangiales bacterium]
MSDLPRWAVTRSAKLASLPIGFAGRTAVGIGKRIGGRPAEIVATEVQQRTAEQIFRVLGELKGGAMKFGQAMSIFEAALPPELAGPYRATLTRLQESAPPMPARTVHRVLAEGLGDDWRESFAEFDDKPAAAASIGQVHRGVWHDGRPVAVKVQYPGAGDALLGDLSQLGRFARLFRVLVPGLDVNPLIAELKDRVTEELDYELEAEAQRTYAKAYLDDPDILVPDAVDGSRHVLVTEWIDGTPLSSIISGGTQEQRDRAGLLLVRFLFSGPALAGLLHADPHPGNFRLMDDGRLGVFDFGAVNRLPDGLPEPIGRMLRLGLLGDAEAVERGLREEGFIRPDVHIDAQELLDYLLPAVEPITEETFRFSRGWLRQEAARITNPRSPAYEVGRHLNLPPSYLLIHRVTLGGTGVLCQLGAEGPFRAELERWLPGFLE